MAAVLGAAEDYDDENYGNQGGNNNQGDSDSYGPGYGGDEGYGSNSPNYQQNLDSDGSNNPNNVYSAQNGNDADGDYEGDDGSAAAASSLSPTIIRAKRSLDTQSKGAKEAEDKSPSASEPKLRVKRHGKYYIGPVYTYVKTDKHANFKWGVSLKDQSNGAPVFSILVDTNSNYSLYSQVKHKVGKKHHG